MPMNRALYPPDWDSIAHSIKEQANWTCQECQRPCRRPGVEWHGFVLWLLETGQEGWYAETSEEVHDNETGEWGVVEKPQRFTLTVAHLNHDPWNPDAELRAWCAPCHCRYDLKAMPLKRKIKLERAGQLTLPLEDHATQIW